MGLKLFSDEDPLQVIKRAILQHEDTFRHQVHELHRLYWTQKNLMHSVSCSNSRWGSTLELEKSLFSFRHSIPPNSPASSPCHLYHEKQRCLDFQMPTDQRGCQHVIKHHRDIGLACDMAAPQLAVELTLGVGDGSDKGKNDTVNSICCREGYLNQQEVIDLDDDMEMVGNEEGVIASSFGPKTPNIFSETRRESKQPRNCVSSVHEKPKKYLGCDQSAHPLTAGVLFDLNTIQPDEDAPICEAEEISSRVTCSSAGCYRSSSKSCFDYCIVQSEPSSRNLVVATAEKSNSSSTNSTSISDIKFSPEFVGTPGVFVGASQQSSNGSLLSLLPKLEKPIQNNALIGSVDAKSVMDTESEVAVERREDVSINSELPTNQEPTDLTVGSNSRESDTGNFCQTGCGDAPEHVVPASGNADISCINSQGNSTTDFSKSAMRDDLTYSCNATCDGRDFTLRWPEEVDRVVLMASTSLIHMSLENPIHSSSVHVKLKEQKGKHGVQPQSSIDTLEDIVLALPEYHEVECSSPLKPTEELMVSSKSRYSSRSGRQLRDFQKDVLPSIVALSRHEICEDMHAFQEIVKSDDLTRKGSARTFTRWNRFTVGRGKQPRRR